MYLAQKEQENDLIQITDYVSNDHVVNPVDVDNLPARIEVRNKIESLAETLFAGVSGKHLKEEKGALSHYYTKGIYCRQMVIPAGTVMVSRLHKLPRLCIIMSGEVSYTTEFGSRRIKGPFTEVFEPGTRVALFTHTDVVWAAIHGTDETDEDKLSELLIAKDHVEYDEYRKQLGLEGDKL